MKGKIEKVMGNNPNSSEINTHINNIRHKLNKIHQVISENEERITDSRMIKELKGETKHKSKMILEVFKEHIEKWIFSAKASLRVLLNVTGIVIIRWSSS